MPTIYKEVEIDVDLDDYDDEDLIEECQRRNIAVYGDADELLTRIWQLRREGRSYDSELEEYIFLKLGKVI